VASYELTRTQKNAVLDAIRETRLDPLEFAWEEHDSSVTHPSDETFTVETLIHRPTEYWFQFDVDDSRSSLWAIYHPGRQGARRREHAGSWEFVFRYLREWLGYVRQEHNAPDFWAELQNQRELMIGELEEVENTPFTPEEQAQIASTLVETKEYVRAIYELSPGQYESIDARLDYLVEAAKRVWAGSTGGTFSPGVGRLRLCGHGLCLSCLLA
jgi:hypothetical protein